MNKKLTNTKIIFGVIYLSLILTALYFLFSYIDFKDLTNIEFIRSNKDIIYKYKNENFLLLLIISIVIVIFWNFCLGFGTPTALAAGFIFGKWIGTLVMLLGNTIGATIIYLIARKFFSELIQKKLGKKFSKFINFFKKNELLYFMFFRLIGGGGTPFPIQNVIPVIFNMRLKNYFFSTLFGIVPTTFIAVALGSGIKSIIEKDDQLSFFSIVQSPEIYLPIIAFIVFLIITFLLKKLFLKSLR
jgi:uncharacterized membrane protein YdjX (TVP38/TMEM64 family)